METNNQYPASQAGTPPHPAAETSTEKGQRVSVLPYRLRDLSDFIDSLELGAADPDGDAMPCNYVAPAGWECAGRCFHSREEARQYFISECVLGSGVDRLIWPGITSASISALAATLHESSQRLGSPIQEAAIRSCLFRRCEQFNYLVDHG